MSDERVFKNQTVIVDDDRISKIGSVERVKIPQGSKIIGGTNQFLMPGLSDMHVHIWDTEDSLH